MKRASSTGATRATSCPAPPPSAQCVVRGPATKASPPRAELSARSPSGHYGVLEADMAISPPHGYHRVVQTTLPPNDDDRRRSWHRTNDVEVSPLRLSQDSGDTALDAPDSAAPRRTRQRPRRRRPTQPRQLAREAHDQWVADRGQRVAAAASRAAIRVERNAPAVAQQRTRQHEHDQPGYGRDAGRESPGFGR